MSDSIRHRGPDDDGTYEDERVALGMRRLAIIDVAHGKQPVFSEDGTVVVVFNGEIYNYRELQSLLRSRGHELSSESDTECLPHLYEEFGLDFVKKLRGMFAIALWDKSRDRLVLARDRLGKKPLFYTADGDRIAFASELHAVVADGRVGRELDPDALGAFLSVQYIPAPLTVYKDVRKLRPAELLVWEKGRIQTCPYWALDFRKREDTSPVPGTEELAEELRHRIIDAVRVRLTSERPVGAFLSGGLDSSAIVAAMSRATSAPIRTFSIGFEEAAFDELPYARRVADLYETDHHEYVVAPEADAILPKIARTFGEPFADSSAIPSYHLAELTRTEVVVALNGDGGDEAFGGYQRYADFLFPTTAKDPGAGSLARAFAGRALGTRTPPSALSAEPLERYGRLLNCFDPYAKRRMLGEDVRRKVGSLDISAVLGEAWRSSDDLDPVNRLLMVDTTTYLPGDLLPKVDLTTMAFSLEARSPLLDHELLEWMATLPGDVKVRGGDKKWLLKRALEPWLPDDLLYRRKQGFAGDIGNWLRGPFSGMVKDLLPSGEAVSRGWLDKKAVERTLLAHRLGSNMGERIYALLMLELWIRECDNRPPEVPA